MLRKSGSLRHTCGYSDARNGAQFCGWTMNGQTPALLVAASTSVAQQLRFRAPTNLLDHKGMQRIVVGLVGQAQSLHLQPSVLPAVRDMYMNVFACKMQVVAFTWLLCLHLHSAIVTSDSPITDARTTSCSVHL